MLPALAKVMICDDLMIMIFYIILPCLPPWPLQSRSNSPGVAQSHASDRASVLDGGIKPSQSSKIPWAHSNGDGSKPVITMFEGITIYYPNYPNIFILRLATQGSFSNTRICRSESPKCLMKSCRKKRNCGKPLVQNQDDAILLGGQHPIPQSCCSLKANDGCHVCPIKSFEEGRVFLKCLLDCCSLCMSNCARATCTLAKPMKVVEAWSLDLSAWPTRWRCKNWACKVVDHCRMMNSCSRSN